jgi:hypothetical protein
MQAARDLSRLALVVSHVNTLFLACAAAGGVVLLAGLVLGALGAEHHGVASHDTPSDGLQLFSVRGLGAGIAFFGVGGLGANALGWPAFVALVLAGLLGAGAMLGVALSMRAMLTMERDGSVQIERAVGVSGTVYVPVPAAMAGAGKVTLVLQGRTVEYQAVTPDGSSLPTGTPVLVVDVRGHDTVEVVPLPSLDGVL